APRRPRERRASPPRDLKLHESTGLPHHTATLRPMANLGDRYHIVENLERGQEPPALLFNLRLLETEAAEVRTEHSPTSERALEAPGDPLMRAVSEHSESIVLERENALLHVGLCGGFVSVQAAGPDEQTVREAIVRLRDHLPAPEPVARH